MIAKKAKQTDNTPDSIRVPIDSVSVIAIAKITEQTIKIKYFHAVSTASNILGELKRLVIILSRSLLLLRKASTSVGVSEKKAASEIETTPANKRNKTVTIRYGKLSPR